MAKDKTKTDTEHKSVEAAEETPKAAAPRKRFFYPHLLVTIEATSKEEADKKAAKLAADK